MHKDWPKIADELNVAIKEVRPGTPEMKLCSSDDIAGAPSPS